MRSRILRTTSTPRWSFSTASVWSTSGARELALKAAELGHLQLARWLAAAAYDRWLMLQNKPQKYGTQYRSDGDRWKLWDVDPATTDAERAAWDVPSLAEALALAEELTRDNPPPLSTTIACK